MHAQISYEAGAAVGIARRLFLPQIFLIIILTFSSCRSETSDATVIAEKLQSISSANYTANITASFPELERSFTLEYTYAKDGDDRAVVVLPEEISGIAFTISEDGTTLDFEGTNLEMGALDKNGLSPLAAIPSLLTVWSGGNISETESTEMFGNDAWLVISRINDGAVPIEYRTWIAKENFIPLYAEIFSDGERVIQCRFERAEHTLQ